MGVATGTVDTEALVADERVVDMQNKFRLLDPDESQFQTILNKLPSQPALREKVNWLEDQYFPRQSGVVGAQTNVDTAIEVTVGQGVYFRAKDLVRNMRTGEMFSVTSVAADTLTVVRGIGGVVAVAMNDLDALLIVGNASAQSDDIGTLKVTTRVLGFNYSQIQRNPFGFSGTEIEIETYGQGDPMNEITKKAVEHRRSIESTLFFGARSFTSASPSSKGTCGGLVEYIATNKFATIGNLSRGVLDDKLRQIFQHGSRRKVIFAAPVPAQALSGLYADNWVKNDGGGSSDGTYGAKATGFISGAFGDRVPVITKREWGMFPTALNGYGSWLFVVDLDYIQNRPMRNRGTALLRNRQGNGEDRVVHEYRTEYSLEVSQESAHGLLTGITGPA